VPDDDVQTTEPTGDDAADDQGAATTDASTATTVVSDAADAGGNGASETPILTRARELHPNDPTLARFHSDEAFLKSYLEQRSMLGRSNEDAQAFRQLRERFGDERLTQLLFAQPPATTTDTKADEWPTLEQYKLWQAEAATGNGDSQAKLERVNTRLGREQLRLASVADKLVGLLETAKSAPPPEQITAQVQQQLEAQRWRDSHVAEVFVEGQIGGEFTPLGQKFHEELQSLRQDGMPDGPRCWERAMTAAKAAMPKSSGTRKAGQGAGRQPTMGNPPKKSEEERAAELMEKFRNDAHQLAKVNEQLALEYGANK